MFFFFRDVLFISIINCVISFIFGFVIFFIFGYMVYEYKVNIEDVVIEGGWVVSLLRRGGLRYVFFFWLCSLFLVVGLRGFDIEFFKLFIGWIFFEVVIGNFR